MRYLKIKGLTPSHSIMLIEDKYNKLCKIPSDINEHFPTLKKYASECETIVELGMRAIVSTWALLAGKPKMMLSVDIIHPMDFGADIQEVYQATEDEGINFIFAQQSSLDISLPEHDLLFIDTVHTYDQLSKELGKHSIFTKKYIIMHDTHHEALPEMMQAIHDFLKENKEWEIAEKFPTSGGLTILKRI